MDTGELVAELPASWGLRTEQTKDGKLAVIGKDDIGGEYIARTCHSGAVTDADVAALAECDRERTTAANFVKGVVGESEARRDAHNREFGDALDDAAGAVVNAGFERISVGYSRSYARNYDRVFGGD